MSEHPRAEGCERFWIVGSADGSSCRCPMTSVPPTQPPAAPETEADANGLTEAEIAFIYDWAPSTTDRRAAMANDLSDLLAARVERIVAERVRVVEGERDAAKADRHRLMRAAGHDLDQACSRAESAEAAHRALQAAVEALADEYDEYGAQREAAGRPAWPNNVARDLRALLAGGEEGR